MARLPTTIRPPSAAGPSRPTGWFTNSSYFSGSACNSGDVDVTGVLIADNTYQISITSSNIDCSNLVGGGYSTQSVNQVFTVVLDGTSSCTPS